ncbi:MAG: radical SAM protein, partial [Pseudonocardiaceae bacterium]
ITTLLNNGLVPAAPFTANQALRELQAAAQEPVCLYKDSNPRNGARRVIETMMTSFSAEGVGDWAVWDATGRINVLHRASDATLDGLARNGLREVALGIESGSERILTLIDKRIDPGMTRTVVRRLTERGINVKGYIILGFPTETSDEIDTTVRLVLRNMPRVP